MNEKRIEILTTMSIPKAILKMAMPTVVGMIVQVVYNLVDTYYIGQMDIPSALAAANLAQPVFMLTTAVAGLVATGGASLISRRLGSGDHDEARRALSLSLVLALGVAAVMTILGSIFMTDIMYLLGAKEDTFQYLYDYLSILIYFTIPNILKFTMSQLIRAEGATVISLMGMLTGTVINIILDPIFIFTLGMGIKGAAIATVIGMCSGMLLYIIMFAAKRTSLRPSFKNLRFEARTVREIFAVGVPSCLSQTLSSIAVTLGNNIAITYGTDVVAGFGVANKIFTMGVFIFMGFTGGCQPLVGYNYGAGNLVRMKKIIRTAVFMSTGTGVVFTAVVMLLRTSLIQIFTNVDPVIAAGTDILSVHCLCFPFMGVGMMGMTATQSMGKPLSSLLLSVSRQGLCYIPLIYTMNALFGYEGFIWSQTVTDMVTAVLGLVILLYVLRKEDRRAAQQVQGMAAND